MNARSSEKLGFIPQLDGLRAFAILPVLLTHSWFFVPDLPISWFGPQGWMGVDLFFVLSGFLITRILLDAKGTPRYYLNFYARRGLRVWPVYYFLLLIVFVISPRVTGPASIYFPHTHFPAYYFIFYLQNTFFGLPTVPFALAVTWSLATEEQFYLVWPLLISWLKNSKLPLVLTGIIVATPIIRIFTYPLLGWASNTFFRFDALAIGALLAWWTQSPAFDSKKMLRLSCYGAGILGVSICVAVYDGRPGLYMEYGYLYLPIAIGFAGLLGLALTLPPSSLFIRILSWAPLRYIGKISYGLYLYHILVFLAVYATPLYAFSLRHGIWGQALFIFAQWVSVFVVATVSWYSFEAPLLRLKSYFRSRSTSGVPAFVEPSAVTA